MSAEILDIGKKPRYDESIIKLETHTHLPYASTKFGNSDEVRIPFQQPDTFVLPSDSVIYIEGSMTPSEIYTLVNNAGAHAFSEIRLEVNGVDVDQTKSPGYTSTMKGYTSYSKATATRLHSAGWTLPDVSVNMPNQTVNKETGKFNMCIPLKTLLGFAEDYKHILINVRLELVLIRANRDDNMFVPIKLEPVPAGTPTPTLEITRISWKLPYVTLSDSEKLRMLSMLERNVPISMAFRSWNLHTYPTLPQTQQHMWNIKTSTQLEKPRQILFGLQTNRSSNVNKNASEFDSCQLKNVRLHIGSETYPYDNLNLDFTKKNVAWLYEMYAQFQHSYYGKAETEPMLTYEELFKHAPLTVIDCSRQVEAITSSAVDIKLEFETAANIPPNTTAFCLILHDQVVTYYPLSGIVTKNT